MKLKKVLIGVLALTVISTIAYLQLTLTGPAEAPAITVSTIRGEKIPLSTLRGRPILVTFWATTCPACIREMPHLVALHKELSPKGFEIIGIAMPYDSPSQVVELARARGLPYPVALDITGDATRAFGGVWLTPSSFLIAPDGRVVYRKTGKMDMPKVRSMIAGMLAQSDSQQTVSTN